MTPSDVHVIFLQALDNGLMRVRLQGPISRINLATPLIDGMVVPRRALGSLVRQTALNMGRRRRLDNDRWVLIFAYLKDLKFYFKNLTN